MARTASSNSTKPRKSKDNGSTHDGETKVQPELDLEPEPLWKKILLAIPRAFGSGVRAVTGVGEYDPAYRRDGLCFLLLVLAVLFCASEWFRVSGPFGQLLHAIAAGVLGLMSVVLPVLLAAVAFRLMRNSGKGSNNPRVVTGWVLLMWSICSIIDVAIAADHTGFDITILQSAGGLFGFFLGSPLAWGLSNVFAIIIFVVVGLFSLLMITGTHVTDLPEDARKIAAKIQRKPYVPMGQETDGSASQFPNEVDVLLDMEYETLSDLNELAEATVGLSNADMEKLGAVVTLAEPKSAAQIKNLAESLDLFDFAPGAHSPAEYGKYMIRQSGYFEYDENLDAFYDYEKYGTEHMNAEDGMFTDRGYIAYKGYISMEEVMNGGQSNHMVLGVLSR